MWSDAMSQDMSELELESLYMQTASIEGPQLVLPGSAPQMEESMPNALTPSTVLFSQK